MDGSAQAFPDAIRSNLAAVLDPVRPGVLIHLYSGCLQKQAFHESEVIVNRQVVANVVVTMKIMPESPEVSFSWLTNQAEPMIAAWGTILKTEKQPIAFGLSALIFTFLMDERKGGTDKLESQISSIKGVIHVEVIDVRRAVG